MRGLEGRDSNPNNEELFHLNDGDERVLALCGPSIFKLFSTHHKSD